MSMNWTELAAVAEEAGFTTLPPNDYHVVVDSAEALKTQNGKDQIKVKFRVASGPYQGKGPIWNQFVVSPESANAMSFFFQHMEVFGISRDYLKQHSPTLVQIAGFLVGRQCTASVIHEDWQGNTRMKVKKIAPVAPAAGPHPVPVPNGAAPVAAPAVAAAPAAPAPAAPVAPVAAPAAPAPVAPAAPAAPVAPPVVAPPVAPAAPGVAPPPSPF